MKLRDFVVREAIVDDLRAVDKESVIKELIEALKKAGKLKASDVEGVVKSMMKREEFGTTGIGGGKAVPHVKHDAVKEIIGTVGRSKKGVDFNALDSEPVYLFFLLVSPTDSTGAHIKALQHISDIIKDDDMCRFLREAKTKRAFIETLAEADER